jgi:hypothetical protein
VIRARELAVMVALTWGVLVCLAASCAWWSKDAAPAVESTFVDCTKGELPTVVAKFAPLLEALVIRSMTGDGKVDWPAVEDATRGLVGDEGGCIVGSVVAKVLHPAPPKPGAPASSPLAVDATDLSLHFEDLRKRRYGGKTFHTVKGDL